MTRAEKQRVKDEEEEETRLHREHMKQEKERQKRDMQEEKRLQKLHAEAEREQRKHEAVWEKIQQKQNRIPQPMAVDREADVEQVLYKPREQEYDEPMGRDQHDINGQMGDGISKRIQILYRPR